MTKVQLGGLYYVQRQRGLDVACRLRTAGAAVTVTDPEALGGVEKRVPGMPTEGPFDAFFPPDLRLALNP